MPESLSAMKIAFTLIVSLGLSLICTPLAMDLAKRLGIIDRPGSARKVHKEPVPYLGGVAIYISFLVATLVFVDLSPEVIAILLGGFVLMVVGAIDDKYDISAKLRLVVQFLCALLAVFSGVCIVGITHPFTHEFLFLEGLGVPLSILWIIATTNVMNFIDGLDGLTGGTTVIVSLTLFFVAWNSGLAGLEGAAAVMLLCTALIGASGGFLRYNFHPAKIFMGDSGAYFIGYVLGCLSIIGPMKQAAVMTMIAPVLALGLPLFDAAVVMFRRIRSGRSPMAADRSHAHHRLFDSGMSQRQTVLWLYAISSCFGLAAISITSNEGRIAAFITGLIGIALFGYAQRLTSKRSAMQETKDLTKAVREYMRRREED